MKNIYLIAAAALMSCATAFAQDYDSQHPELKNIMFTDSTGNIISPETFKGEGPYKIYMASKDTTNVLYYRIDGREGGFYGEDGPKKPDTGESQGAGSDHSGGQALIWPRDSLTIDKDPGVEYYWHKDTKKPILVNKNESLKFFAYDEDGSNTSEIGEFPIMAVVTEVRGIETEDPETPVTYYTLQGIEAVPAPGNIYIRVSDGKALKVYY